LFRCADQLMCCSGIAGTMIGTIAALVLPLLFDI
jgi:hypothetical protein